MKEDEDLDLLIDRGEQKKDSLLIALKEWQHYNKRHRRAALIIRVCSILLAATALLVVLFWIHISYGGAGR